MKLTLKRAIAAALPDAPESMRLEIGRNLILDGKREAMPAEIRCAGEVARVNRWSAGEEIDLVGDQLRLFAALYSIPFGHVLAFRDLVNAGFPKFGTRRAAEIAARELRPKLGFQLEHVWGIGYRFGDRV